MRRRVLLLNALLAGCGLSERPYVERREWPLEVTRPGVAPARAGGKVLRVRDVQAGPGARERGVQVLRVDGSVDVGFYDEWAATPADSLTEGLRAWLASSGLFAAVVGPESDAAAGLSLEATLTRFVGDPPRGAAEAGLTIVLSGSSGGRLVLLERALTGRAPLASADAAATVAALRAAVGDAFGQVERALAPFG